MHGFRPMEPAGANCLQVSIKEGKVTTLEHVSTIADGTAVKTPATWHNSPGRSGKSTDTVKILSRKIKPCCTTEDIVMTSMIADGTAVKTPGSKIFPYLCDYLDDVLTVEDEELVVAFLDMVENHKMIAAHRHVRMLHRKRPRRELLPPHNFSYGSL